MYRSSHNSTYLPKAIRSFSMAILLFVFVIYTNALFSQEHPIELVPAIKSGELPEIDVNSIAQDSAGFLWIGTWKGLYRYDGRHVINYSQQLNNRIGRKISALYLDKKGNLWIGTYSEGLFVYNPKNQSIYSYESINKTITGNIIDIIGSAGDQVMVSSYDGIFIYDLVKEKFDPQTLSYGENGNNFRLTTASRDSKNNLWVGSDQGLLRYDNTHKRLVNTHQLKGLYVHKIIELPNGLLAVSSLQGTDLFEEINGVLIQAGNNPIALVLSKERGESYASLIIKSEPDQLWVALQNGLLITDIKTGAVISRPVFISGKELNSFKVESVFEDRQGIVWVGTSSGLYKYDRNHKPFDMSAIGESNCEVISVAQTGGNAFWAGTNGKGMYFVNVGLNGQPTMQRKLTLKGGGAYNPMKNDISGITAGFDGDVWFSTKGSGIVHVKKMSIGSNEVTATSAEYFNESNSQADNHVMTLYRDSKGVLWGGGWSGGLIRYEDEKNTFIRLKGNWARELKKYPIVKIIEAGSNTYYLGTRGSGLIRIETNSTRDSVERMVKYVNKLSDTSTICNNFVSDFILMPDNKLWITTESGLSILDPATGKFINTGINEGLQNAVLQSIVSISPGEIWVASENGLSKIIVRNGLPDRIRNFNHYDGLEISFYNTSCFINNKDNGILYVGGKEGLCYFDPFLITDSRSIPSVLVTQISLFNQLLVAGQEYDGRLLLENSPWYSKKITLKYFQNTLSFSFSGMDFSVPEKITYAYQLEGLDKNWIYTSTPECNYPRLKYGTYTLKVKCSNSDGIWNEQITRLEIRILPPWWFSTPAYVIYFLLLIIANYFIYRLITYRQRIRIRQMEQEQEIEMYDMRMRFYTNISHEFRTPLTLIMGLTSRLRMNDDPGKRTDFYEKIDRNAKILLRLITDLMDLRKIEKEEIRLRREKINPSQFFRQSCESFADLFSTKGLEFKYSDKAGGEVMIEGDPVRLESVVYNLLSNAFKYTNKNGSVECSIELVTKAFQQKSMFQVRYRIKEPGEYLAFRVKDTGVGMTRSQVRNIFNKFQMNGTPNTTETNSTSYGIGLLFTKSLVELHHGFIEVESENNKGTTVTVYLPCVQLSNVDTAQLKSHSESVLISGTTAESGSALEKISRKGDEKIILVIDDNTEIRDLLKDILVPEYKIVEAVDGLDGWNKASEVVPDLIISDILMPGMDGNKLCEKIKTTHLTNHIPVILLTALPTSEDRIKGLKHGADSYIPKPFETEHLLVRIEKLIGSRNVLKEKYMKDFLVTPEKSEETEINPSAEYIARIKKIIEQNITEPEYDVADLCRDLGTSRMQLYRKLKATVGYSANELIRKIRLHKAAELLLRGDLNIAQVTYEVGFSDLQYFRMCFKDEFEQTPSQYIRVNTKDTDQAAGKIDPFDPEEQEQ